MALAVGQREQMAATVAERAAEVFARVAVVDDHGAVLASNVPMPWSDGDGDRLSVPVRFGSEKAEVVVAEPVNGEVISPRLAGVLVELIVTQTVAFSRLPNQHELKDRFIHGLLRGTINDEAEMLREGQILGLDLTLPRAVILVDASEYILSPSNLQRVEAREAQIRRRAQVVIASIVHFFSLPNDTICAHIGNGEIAILKASSTPNLVAWTDRDDPLDEPRPSWANLAALRRASNDLLGRLRHDTRAAISIGIGRYHPGIRGLACSYQDALAALSLGRRFQGTNRVHCLDGLGIAAFIGVADEQTKIDLATHLLSPVDHEPELIQTVDTFFSEDCCPSTTASRLFIHRNTLSYRLDKIAALTGLDPRRFKDAVQIQLALLLRSFHDGPAMAAEAS